MNERRRNATQAEVRAALEDLDRQPDRISAATWPAHLTDLDGSGLYSWWVDEGGAADLAEGLGVGLADGRIYAGQTGATKWPSGKIVAATLRGRVGTNHLRGRIRGSTFRLTLAAALRGPLGLVVEGLKRLAPESEAELSIWMQAHLEVAVHPFSERDALADLESSVLPALDPPCNLDRCPPTSLRLALADLRADLSRGPGPGFRSATPPPTERSASTTADLTGGEPGRVTLHQEIADILRQQGWMTTKEIADAVNRRGRYVKRDGSAMTAFQVHGRTRNYPHLFERDGSRVRLRR